MWVFITLFAAIFSSASLMVFISSWYFAELQSTNASSVFLSWIACCCKNRIDSANCFTLYFFAHWTYPPFFPYQLDDTQSASHLFDIHITYHLVGIPHFCSLSIDTPFLISLFSDAQQAYHLAGIFWQRVCVSARWYAAIGSLLLIQASHTNKVIHDERCWNILHITKAVCGERYRNILHTCKVLSDDRYRGILHTYKAISHNQYRDILHTYKAIPHNR